MYCALNAILDSRLTDDHLHFSFLYFLRQEAGEAIEFDIDVPIKSLFSATLTEDAFVLVIALFELHHAINIPDEFCNWSLTLREFLRRVSILSRLSPGEYCKHLHELVAASRQHARPN